MLGFLSTLAIPSGPAPIENESSIGPPSATCRNRPSCLFKKGNSVFKLFLGLSAEFCVLGGWAFTYTEIRVFLFLFEHRGCVGEEEG